MQLLVQHILTLSRYDQDYDVRDRVRNVGLLLATVLAKTTSWRVDNNDHMNGYDDDEDPLIGAKFRPEQLELIFFEGKTTLTSKHTSISMSSNIQQSATDTNPLVSGVGYALGSVENVIQKQVYTDSRFCQRLPDWAEQGSDPYLRDTDEPQSNIITEARAVYATSVPRPVTPIETLVPSSSSHPTEGFATGSQKHVMSLEEFYSEDAPHSAEEGSEEEEEEEAEDDDEKERDDQEGSEVEESGTESDESSGEPSE